MAAGAFIFRNDDGRTGEERLKTAALLGGYGKRLEGRSGMEVGAADGPELWRAARTARGKPYFPNQPELHFSISHSGDFWVCVFSESHVGIDIQKHVGKKGESGKEANYFERLAKRFFHLREAEWVGENPDKRFFQIWTAKESYVKYTGKGIDPDFCRFCLAPDDWQMKQEKRRILKDVFFRWEAEGLWFYSMEFSGEYTLCICCEKTEESVKINYLI